MRIARQKSEKKKSISLLFKLTRRTALFFFLFLCVLILFFVIGNYQQFLDSDLRLILKTAAASAYALACFSAAGLAEGIVFLFLDKNAAARRFYIVHGILMLLASAAGVLFLTAFRILDLLSLGFA